MVTGPAVDPNIMYNIAIPLAGRSHITSPLPSKCEGETMVATEKHKIIVLSQCFVYSGLLYKNMAVHHGGLWKRIHGV